MKTYHLDPKDPIWDNAFHEKMDRTYFQKDLAPYVKYSINKKRRWEAQGNMDILTDLQNAYRDMDVFVSERVWLKTSPLFSFISQINYYHNYLLDFNIRRIHQITDNDGYQCFSSDSVFGQPYKCLLPENRLAKKPEDSDDTDGYSTPKVAYHIITPPKNYEKLRNSDFCPGSSDRWGHRTLTHWRRTKIMRDALLSLRYEQFEDLDEDVDMTDDYLIYDRYDPPREFYNLEDHLVDNFVYVKRNNGRVSSDSSSWSVVSDN